MYRSRMQYTLAAKAISTEVINQGCWIKGVNERKKKKKWGWERLHVEWKKESERKCDWQKRWKEEEVQAEWMAEREKVRQEEWVKERQRKNEKESVWRSTAGTKRERESLGERERREVGALWSSQEGNSIMVQPTVIKVKTKSFTTYKGSYRKFREHTVKQKPYIFSL